MKIIQILFLFFLIIPFIEIYWLLQIGGMVGVFPTILLVIFTALLGAWLLKKQGLSTWKRFQKNVEKKELPAYEIIEGVLLLISGALLLTPGFFTDLIGFAFLVPNIRQKIAKIIIEKYLVQTLNPSSSKLHETLEGDFTRED
jgi:UPF0716 protein FxsA